jgi:hypothetical protein
MKFYKEDGKENIGSTKPLDITLETALKEIESLPEVEGNFIGFINDEEETIQFVRFDDEWLIDVPVIEKGKYAYSLQDSGLSTGTVNSITKAFFIGDDWRSFCDLTK